MAQYQKEFFKFSNIDEDKYGNTVITLDAETLSELIEGAKQRHSRYVKLYIGTARQTGRPYVYYLTRQDDAAEQTDNSELPF